MKILAAICVLAVSVSAQVGPAGIIDPSGKNIQFSHHFADSIVLSGPSGIVTKDGKNLQLTGGQAALNAATPSAPQPVAQYVTYSANVGPSGIVNPDGRNVQFSQEAADNVVLVGPSGIVSKDGKNIQLTESGTFRAKRSSAGYVLPAGNIGYSGILRADGTYDLFSHDFAHDIAAIGPAGIVTFSGKNYQLDDNLHRIRRELRGPSGMILSDGTPVQFKEPFATIVLDGPSGFQLSDGTLVQKRLKRDLVGPSGIILADGTPVQFKTPFSTILLNGPSGYVLSDGQLIQKRQKRATVGPSGMILPDGTPVQFAAHTSPVVSGPSGIVFDNGQNVQFP